MSTNDRARATLEKDLAQRRTLDRRGRKKVENLTHGETAITLDGLITVDRPQQSSDDDMDIHFETQFMHEYVKPVPVLDIKAFRSPRKKAVHHHGTTHGQLFQKLERAGFYPDRGNLQRKHASQIGADAAPPSDDELERRAEERAMRAKARENKPWRTVRKDRRATGP